MNKFHFFYKNYILKPLSWRFIKKLLPYKTKGIHSIYVNSRN